MWQKWVGKLLPWAIAAGDLFWSMVLEGQPKPDWWVVVPAAIGLVQLVLSLIPPKAAA
jgi:hypothetical protein